MENQIISINLVPNMSTPQVVNVSQYDVGRPLVFKVYDGTSPADLTGVTAVIEGTKKSGLGFSESGTVSGNTVTLDTTLAMTQEDGSIPAEIRFSKTGEDVGTANFIFAVEKTPHADGTTDGTHETMADLQSQLDALDTRVEALEAGGGGSGLTQAEKNLILELFSKAAYAESDASTAYDALESLWTTTTRTITYNLSHVTSSNTATSVEGGSSYTTTLTATGSYTLNTVTVTMGGVDITSTAYSSGTITIPSVTGNIVITATAVLAAQSITATYTQSGTVYDTDSLDSLKADLVVTANYSGGTTETVPSSDYTLSGTLTEGTSTITVSYAGLTTTFNVTVTESLYVSGMIHRWDGIDNTLNGHDSTTATWYDLVGSSHLARSSDTITWNTDSAVFQNVSAIQTFTSAESSESCAGKSFEVVFEPSASQAAGIAHVFNDSNASGKACIYSDNTFNVIGNSAKTYPSGQSAITDLHYICGVFNSSGGIDSVYANGVAVTVGNTTHSLTGQKTTVVLGQTDSGYKYKGKIYAVRVYDKMLTASEVAQNYATDVERFNLGA